VEFESLLSLSNMQLVTLDMDTETSVALHIVSVIFADFNQSRHV